MKVDSQKEIIIRTERFNASMDFGGINRNDLTLWLGDIIPDRRRETLLQLIQQLIKKGTTISHYGLRAFDKIDSLFPGYDFEEDKRLNHSEILYIQKVLKCIQKFWRI